ncbi:DUF5302 family protein [Granulicoccus sp. GXG6511]|uniref:DUF5302 family protein n=1 Tax=Granulicoccus sp. GXG6511 TaxID=3381351 RepID=UPI003D7E9395
MSTADGKDASEPTAATDPKEAMREALERKRGGNRQPHGRADHHRDGGGKAHGQAGGRREFRRKAGG